MDYDVGIRPRPDVSTATAFKYHRQFPFCVEDKTEAEIAAIVAHPSDGEPQYARWKGTLAQVMNVWWNLESAGFTIYFTSPTNTMSLNAASAVPRGRVCYSSGLWYGGGANNTRFSLSANYVFSNLTSGDYEILFSVGGASNQNSSITEFDSTGTEWAIGYYRDILVDGAPIRVRFTTGWMWDLSNVTFDAFYTY